MNTHTYYDAVPLTDPNTCLLHVADEKNATRKQLTANENAGATILLLLTKKKYDKMLHTHNTADEIGNC